MPDELVQTPATQIQAVSELNRLLNTDEPIADLQALQKSVKIAPNTLEQKSDSQLRLERLLENSVMRRALIAFFRPDASTAIKCANNAVQSAKDAINLLKNYGESMLLGDAIDDAYNAAGIVAAKAYELDLAMLTTIADYLLSPKADAAQGIKMLNDCKAEGRTI